MKLETVGGYHVIDAVDQALMGLIIANRTPGVYAAGTCSGEYKRVFRDDVENLWVCECANES